MGPVEYLVVAFPGNRFNGDIVPALAELTDKGIIRDDGLMQHDMYIMQVKTPAESKKPWDYYKLVQTMSGEQAFGKLADSTCPLVKK